MPSRRPSTWVWIVAAVVGLPLLYVLSFGPACWMASRLEHSPVDGPKVVSAAYQPILRFAVHGPAWAYPAATRFAAFGTDGNWVIVFHERTGTVHWERIRLPTF